MNDEVKIKAIATRIVGFFLSLRTAIWLLMALLCLLLYGSVIMPVKEEFQALRVVPLFQWMTENSPDITWWLWAAIGVISLLTANTLLCSLESVIKKRSSRQWLLVISPQVAHMGFLFILLAHFISGYSSFRGTAVVYENSGLSLPNGTDVLFKKIDVAIDPRGFMSGWSAEVEYFRAGRPVGTDRIKPNSPSFMDGLGIYIKDIQLQPAPVAMIEVSKDPGAIWALIGGVFFMAGMMTLLLLKIKIEEAKGER